MRALVLKYQNQIDYNTVSYRFHGNDGIVSWPMQNGAFLGTTGTWNFLFRIGMHPKYVTVDDATMPQRGDLLFITAENDDLSENVRDTIDGWLANGGTIISGGFLRAWRWLLPAGVDVAQVSCEYPYAALAWKFGDDQPELIASPLWTYNRLINKGDVLTCGRLVAVRGERQTPDRAFITPLPDAPAIISYKNFVFLNGNPFGAFQAWLQGQEDLGPWAQWRHRLFWLDEQVAFLLRSLNEHAALSVKIVPRAIPGLSDTTIVLRHDLDNSRDTSYLDAERAVGLPGVHAVLRDKNTYFWIQALRDLTGHEISFHYTTARYNRWLEWTRSRLGLAKHSYKPAHDLIAGDGLLRQVRWAKKSNVGINTLHRHQPFLIYPEWIDALHNVFEKEPDVLGGSSLFRAQVLRWGCNRADGAHGTYGVFPDAQFPYWFPCKLAHAGLGGVPLRGWESSSVMEIEPDLFKQMLDYRVPGILQKIITINYHPAHAHRRTFCAQGSLPWFKDILRIMHERGIESRTLCDIYAAMDRHIIE